MPEPDYSEFDRAPMSLLDFMATNIIATGLLPNSTLNSVPEFLTLEKKTTPVTVGGEAVGHVYYLKGSTETSSARALNAYICDYEKNDTKFVLLGQNARFCFTITMNGCTFGIGKPGSDGSVIVSHSNRASDPNQAETQRRITLDSHKNRQVTMLEPSMYRPVERMTCTTFGIRAGRQWKFYFQSYRPNGSTWELYGVPEIKTNSLVH